MITWLIGPYWESVAMTAGITAIIGLGLYISNSAGALSAAHAALAGMGGYLGAILTTNFGRSFPEAVVAGCLFAGCGGLFLALVTLRMNALVAGLTTLAFGETLVVITYNIAYVGAGSSFYGIPPDTTFTWVYATLGVAMVLGWRFERSRLGLAARACRDNPVAADAMGINVTWAKVAVFSLGAGLAGVGGVLQAHYILVLRPAQMGFVFSLPLIIIWVFGGSYVFWGSVFGAFTLIFLPELLRFSNQQRYMLYGLILAAVVVLRPQGVITRVPLGRRSAIRRNLGRLAPWHSRTPRDAPVR